MLNQTTNTRFTKHRKENASEQAIAALAEYEPSDIDDDDFTTPFPSSPQTHRTRASRVTAIDVPMNQGCVGNCSNMFCGAGHFRKQERIMRKFIKDPNTSVNQSNYPNSANNRSSEAQSEPIPGSVGRYMADSYAKRQMFYYGVEADAAAQ